MSTETILTVFSLGATILLGVFVLIPKLRENKDNREDVIARRRGEELTRLYERLDVLEQDFGLQAEEIKNLKVHVALSDRRENLMYHHTKALREHILSELPPPPPVMPQELVEWFEEFERTDPHRTH